MRSFSDFLEMLGLGKYKGIPPELYPQFITDYHLTHEVAGRLKVFVKKGVVNNKRGKYYRVFDLRELKKRENEKGIQFPDYDSLSKAPELIAFECFVMTDEPYTTMIEDRRGSKTLTQ